MTLLLRRRRSSALLALLALSPPRRPPPRRLLGGEGGAVVVLPPPSILASASSSYSSPSSSAAAAAAAHPPAECPSSGSGAEVGGGGGGIGRVASDAYRSLSEYRRGDGDDDDCATAPPFVSPREMMGGTVRDVPTDDGEGGVELSDVYGCCGGPGPPQDVAGGVGGGGGGGGEGGGAHPPLLLPRLLGRVPRHTSARSLSALTHAVRAWDGGSGPWPQTSLSDRIRAVESFLLRLESKREYAVRALMWEIGKSRPDSESEFDRTIEFARRIIDALRDDESGEYNSRWESVGSIRAFVRRGPIGVILCLGPFNYPLNETYATLIPALLMGNVVIMKIPAVGGLVHVLTMDAFAESFPPGAVGFISGSGRATVPPLMETGEVDGLAFIGGSKAADDLIRKHPEPHRLKVFLQLEAKNMGVFLPDLFEAGMSSERRLRAAIDEAVLGSLSYNGQRCTALKILFVPRPRGAEFARALADRVEGLRVGLPWQTFDGDGGGGDRRLYSQITPLPNRGRVERMRGLIDDALSKGANIVNEDGGTIIGGDTSTLMIPAVLYPVTPDMDVYAEEQFGPVVPVVEYDDIDDVLRYGREGRYGQQASLFTSRGGEDAAAALDSFANVFGRINVNAQCGRSPDTLPFSGRRSSAMGVMSVTDALREFSVPTVIAYRDGDGNGRIAEGIGERSRFMAEL